MAYINKIEISGTAYDIQDTTALPLAGGTMTGELVLSANPTNNLGAVPKQYVDQFSPITATALPTSGAALTANAIYAVSADVNTYNFVPPDSGWAHGNFTTGTSPNLTFEGNVIGSLPTFTASTKYEFDVYNGVWIVQEVLAV